MMQHYKSKREKQKFSWRVIQFDVLQSEVFMLEVCSFSSMETMEDWTGFCVCVGFIWISGDSLFDIQEKQLHEDLKNCSRVSFFFQLHYKSCLQMIRLFLNGVIWKKSSGT